MKLKSQLVREQLHQATRRFRSVAFIDVETTGKYAEHDRVIELAMLTLSSVELGQWISGLPIRLAQPHVFRFNPGIPIPEEASEIHGITTGMVRNCPRLNAAFLQKLTAELSQRCLIVGHNVSFDLRFIQGELNRLGAWPSMWPVGLRHACTMQRYRKLFPGRPYKLDACLSAFSIIGRATSIHGAGEDVLLTARLFADLAKHEMRIQRSG